MKPARYRTLTPIEEIVLLVLAKDLPDFVQGTGPKQS